MVELPLNDVGEFYGVAVSDAAVQTYFCGTGGTAEELADPYLLGLADAADVAAGAAIPPRDVCGFFHGIDLRWHSRGNGKTRSATLHGEDLGSFKESVGDGTADGLAKQGRPLLQGEGVGSIKESAGVGTAEGVAKQDLQLFHGEDLGSFRESTGDGTAEGLANKRSATTS